LALDGGGIRGALTLGFLTRIEQILRERTKNPNLVLRDYFDLIGGTSTGAIIAAGLAFGKSADEIKKIYLELGGRVFGGQYSIYFKAKFDERPLIEELRRVFGEEALDSELVTTGLCVVAKRADTGSTWPLFNHPDGKYFDDNRKIKIWEALRASAAAPTYFRPQYLTFSDGSQGAFVDGGLSMANDPSLQVFLAATLNGYPFHWRTGAETLMLVSIGTGIWHRSDDPDEYLKYTHLGWAAEAPAIMMDDATWQNQLLLQYFSNSPTAVEIDAEVGNLSGDLIASNPLLTYLRYNAELSEKRLEELGFPRSSEDLELLRKMDRADSRHTLFEIGEAAAKEQIEEAHFPIAFDLG
jgi:hypothetical protein